MDIKLDSAEYAKLKNAIWYCKTLVTQDALKMQNIADRLKEADIRLISIVYIIQILIQ